MKIVFAYGSNMNFNRLKERTPSAKKVANALLPNYRIVCNKLSANDGSAKANIISDTVGTGVWGIVYEIPDSEKPELDKAEGKGRGYNEHTVTVFDTDTKPYSALVYIADETATKDGIKPFDWYKEFIVTGAVQNSLPDIYVERLKAIKDEIDPDEDRRARNLGVI